MTDRRGEAFIATVSIAVLVFAAFAGAYANGPAATPPAALGPFAIVVAAMIAGVAAYIAARTAATISYSNKIGEFRQAWINELRKEIADYIAAAEKWFWKWDELNLITDSDVKSKRNIKEAVPLSIKARTILNRMRCRFNPRENADKQQDDKFLKSLDDLLNPNTFEKNNEVSSWIKRIQCRSGAVQRNIETRVEKTKAVIDPTRASSEES